MDATTRNLERFRGPPSEATSYSSPRNSSSMSAPRRGQRRDPYSDDMDSEEEKQTAQPNVPRQSFSPSPERSPPRTRDDISEIIPEEYKRNLENTEPMLLFIPQCPEDATLARLLKAAQDDIRLHQARIKAAVSNDVSLVRNYNFETDIYWQERQQRKRERLVMLASLQREARKILQELDEDKKGLTQAERIQVKLARWQRALELYIYSPAQMEMDMLGLLEKLLEGSSEEEEMSEILSQASQMCSTLVDLTSQAVRDASDDAAEAEDAYQIRLEAHATFARNAMMQAEEIQSQFRINGRAALQIGHQLEFAESKRNQCETASILIRRWWMMETLAEQEALSHEELRVNEEVHGIIPMASCRMDSLFTAPERSLEAAKALKQLRAVVRSRGNAATAATTASSGYTDPNASRSTRRFDLTARLIARTSSALENRLLNSFKKVYSAGGGGYDRTDTPRPGHMDWSELRELAQALLLFDSGRNLRDKYLECVINSRFPELFKPKKLQPGNDEELEFNMEKTRSMLSSLFHRVSDGCTAEFELIARVFGPDPYDHSATIPGSEEMPLTVARALLQRVISDPKNGLQARITELLESIDRRGDFDQGAKKLDTFVVIHEKAAGLFSLLKEAAERMLIREDRNGDRFDGESPEVDEASANAVASLKQFLSSQEIALSNGHRRSYLNLELRLLHHDCCCALSQIPHCELVTPYQTRADPSAAEKGILEEFRAPVLPLKGPTLMQGGYIGILSGPLKSSVLRQPLICATDSLARARLMYGFGKKGGEATARVITSIYNQMCNFYGHAFLYPIVDCLGELLPSRAPSTTPTLEIDENNPAPDLGVDPAFWVGLERVHSAAKSFDRELWAENRPGSARVWEILMSTGGIDSMNTARNYRIQFFSELESKGEQAIVRALTTLNEHIRWILVLGGESMSATGGRPIRHHITGQNNGPYSIPAGSSLEAPNSPAVKTLTFCLRSQFVNIQAALTPQALSSFWTALSMRLYDVLVPRLLQHYYVSTVGAVILSRDVEALRSVSMLAGSEHTHWDNLRELVTLYMTPPDALKTMLVGPEGDINAGKGLFKRVGRQQALVFMSRRIDYRYKTAQGPKKSGWAIELLDDLGLPDPTDGHGITSDMLGAFAAHRFMTKKQ